MIFIGAYERFANRVYTLAVEREREECAKVCEAQDTEFSINAEWMRERCVAAIRAKGNT